MTSIYLAKKATGEQQEDSKHELTLYTYWRSSASWRVRLGLHLKGIPFTAIPINLVKGEQREEEYKKINPNATVPSLVVDGGQCISQSGAILEFLEEMGYGSSILLLPTDALERARYGLLI